MLILIIAPLQGESLLRGVVYESILRVLTGDILGQYARHCDRAAGLQPIVYEELDLAICWQLRVALPELHLQEAGHEEGERHQEGARHYPLQGGGQQTELA